MPANQDHNQRLFQAALPRAKEVYDLRQAGNKWREIAAQISVSRARAQQLYDKFLHSQGTK